jgi:hypothetical protein
LAKLSVDVNVTLMGLKQNSMFKIKYSIE